MTDSREELLTALREALQPFVDAAVDGSGRLIVPDGVRERARAVLARAETESLQEPTSGPLIGPGYEGESTPDDMLSGEFQ